MDEKEKLKKLEEENSALLSKLETATGQIAALQQQNAVLLQQNGEILVKLDCVLKNQNSNINPVLPKKKLVQTNLEFGTSLKRVNSDVLPNESNTKNTRMSASTSNGTSVSDPLVIVMDSSNLTSENEQTQSNSNGEILWNGEQFSSWADAVEEATIAKKPTPLQLKSYDKVTTNKIYIAITKHFKDGGFKWRQSNINSPARIYCDNAEDKLSVMEYLKQNNIEFNTYTDSTSRLRAFIVRGLVHGNDDVIGNDISIVGNDISNTLESYGITGPIKIERFFTSKNVSPKHLHRYLKSYWVPMLIFQRSQQLSKLDHSKFLLKRWKNLQTFSVTTVSVFVTLPINEITNIDVSNVCTNIHLDNVNAKPINNYRSDVSIVGSTNRTLLAILLII